MIKTATRRKKTSKWTCTPCGEKFSPSKMADCPTCTSYLCPTCKDGHTRKACDYLRILLANCTPKWKDQELPIWL